MFNQYIRVFLGWRIITLHELLKATKNVVLFVALIHFNGYHAQQKLPNTGIIPQVRNSVASEGVFVLSESTALYAGTAVPQTELAYFAQALSNHFQLQPKIVSNQSNKCIRFTAATDSSMGPEAYYLSILPDGIEIQAKKGGAGFFYGMQSLMQYIYASKSQTQQFALPCIRIKDEPRYKWRGMHLDVSRHFFPVAFIKKYIDVLATYKLNTFHWHLTDDQGWRIEIKKYPRLTGVGAWRKGSMIGPYSDHKFDTLRYGGYYSQEEIREVVSYANQRHITVVPEIEMPGHSVAAIAAYPFLSCTGKQIEVEKAWGVFNDVYCSKDSVFTFLQDVLDEVIALFPGTFIHIGGDECPKENWKHCQQCQKRIRENNLKDEHELQSYFITRISKYLNAKGKQIIGWDEILEGGLPPGAAVMSWRGTEGGIAAARAKHMVVMSPGQPCYFDHYQNQPIQKEPLAIGGYNPLDSVYAFDPTPQALNLDQQKYIMGAQANVWTEYILTPEQVEYMALPRMCALSEVLWSFPQTKNRKQFIQRLKAHQHMLDKLNLNYAKHFLEQ